MLEEEVDCNFGLRSCKKIEETYSSSLTEPKCGLNLLQNVPCKNGKFPVSIGRFEELNAKV